MVTSLAISGEAAGQRVIIVKKIMDGAPAGWSPCRMDVQEGLGEDWES